MASIGEKLLRAGKNSVTGGKRGKSKAASFGERILGIDTHTGRQRDKIRTRKLNDRTAPISRIRTAGKSTEQLRKMKPEKKYTRVSRPASKGKKK